MNFLQSRIIILLFVLIWPADGFCARVKGIHSGTEFELDDGRRIRLAGVDVSAEGRRMLPALVGGRDVEIDEDSGTDELKGGNIPAAYVYVRINELIISGDKKRNESERRIMINELLLETGAAKVAAGADFKKREKFNVIEQAA